MANENFILVDSVDVYNKAFGLNTLHPLVSVVDLSKATKTLRRALMHYGGYALFLKHGDGCALYYGRQKYDYQEDTFSKCIKSNTLGQRVIHLRLL